MKHPVHQLKKEKNTTILTLNPMIISSKERQNHHPTPEKNGVLGMISLSGPL